MNAYGKWLQVHSREVKLEVLKAMPRPQPSNALCLDYNATLPTFQLLLMFLTSDPILTSQLLAPQRLTLEGIAHPSFRPVLMQLVTDHILASQLLASNGLVPKRNTLPSIREAVPEILKPVGPAVTRYQAPSASNHISEQSRNRFNPQTVGSQDELPSRPEQHIRRKIMPLETIKLREYLKIKPYPNREDKNKLAGQMKLGYEQISNWFLRERHRKGISKKQKPPRQRVAKKQSNSPKGDQRKNHGRTSSQRVSVEVE